MAQETFTVENLNEHARKNREHEYKKVADPLYMKWQRGEIEKKVWLEAVQSIKEKYPFYTKPMTIEVPEEDYAVTLDT